MVSGKKYWADGLTVKGQQFGYDFDDIGNRKSATRNARSESYTVNSVNQYTQRTVPGGVDVLGTAATNATVLVNDQATARHGEYFYKEVAVDNTSSAAYELIRVRGVKEGAGAEGADLIGLDKGHAFVAKNPEGYSYVSEGYLDDDGRWSYQWDEEARLIVMQTLPSVVAAVGDSGRRRLEFAYDHQGRRIQKKVYTWNAGTSSYELQSTLKFLYDGWNLIGEFDATNGLVRSYTWGTDLSGTMQGAGGIGGLLFTTHHLPAATTHFVAFDGNGNVGALVNASTGATSAQYEYGPFGETLRATGPAADANPIRFSAKYTDAETGLVYYGYRYYRSNSGKWLSRDPAEERAGANLYSYVLNDGVDSWDFLGAFTDCCMNKPYETDTHSCCRGKIIPNLEILDEFFLMKDYATVWNVTSAKYNKNNQCYEQATALVTFLTSLWPGPTRKDYFVPVLMGGRKSSIIFPRHLVDQHYVVAIEPRCEPHALQLNMVFDPMKKPASASGVKQASWDNLDVEVYDRIGWRSMWPFQPISYGGFFDPLGSPDIHWNP